MVSTFAVILIILASIVGLVLLPFVLWKFFKGVSWLTSHVFAFIGGIIGDSLRLVGGLITALVFLPLAFMNIAIGRWSASGHFWRSFQDEIVGCGHCIYRIAIGHPARLLMLTPLTEGLERRVPEAFAQSPTRDTPSKRTGAFEGYTIVGSLKGGGSGGKLFIAKPDQAKLNAFSRRGRGGIDKVVIKSFSVQDGSTLPQIVRESRALEAARDLGLVLDHELTGARFFYAMPYVPGDPLSTVTERLHSKGGKDQLVAGLGYIADLLSTLDTYHAAGLWHKDIKPDNIIVGPDGRAHLVDLGLVTPLRSAMTLTTHGTEYFRDPELVRQALRGVKVHEVPGVKFDVYGAGACLFALVEHSFPAHGGLSQITRKCPEALRWIVRRSMADLNQRYESAHAMLEDVEYVRQAPDPFAVKPAELPSMSGGVVEDLPEAPQPVSFTPPVATPQPPRASRQEPAPAQKGRKPRLSVVNWWTGAYKVDEVPPQQASPKASPYVVPVDQRRPATEQIANARQRVNARRERANQRMRGHHSPVRKPANKAFLPGVLLFVFFFIAIGIVGLLVPALSLRSQEFADLSPAAEFRYPLLVSDVERTRSVELTDDELVNYIDDIIDDPFVVLDPNNILRDREDSPFRRLLDRLEGHGTDIDTSPETGTEAARKALVGTALPGNPEATLDLLSWLQNADAAWDYEGIIWIGAPGPGSAEAPAWQLIYNDIAPVPEANAASESSVYITSEGEERVWSTGQWREEGWWDTIGTTHTDSIKAVRDRVQGEIERAQDTIRDEIDRASDAARDAIERAGGSINR